MTLGDFAQGLFAICFIGGFALALMTLAFLFVNRILAPLIQMAYPSFAELNVPKYRAYISRKIAKQTVAETKAGKLNVALEAIEFIAQENIRRARELKKENSWARVSHLPKVVSKDTDWKTISSLETVKPTLPHKPEALWALARFPHGASRPVWLCYKASFRGAGLKVLFTEITTQRLTFDLETAQRWASVIPDTTVCPASAAARILVQKETTEASYV